jgi:ABC-type nitrate/sulfonate/bicarbonate transport system substrate-binding protein
MFDFKAPLQFAVCYLAALAILFCFAIACQSPQKPAGPSEKITIAYGVSTGMSLVHIALAKEFFSEEGLDATPQPHTTGKSTIDAVIEKKADLAAAADTPIMFAVMDGKNITTIAVISTSNKNMAIVARKDRGISRPADLKGKTLGIMRGTISDFFADTFLMTHGIDRKQVTIIDLKLDEIAGALGTGRVDAVSIWQPVLIKLQKDLGIMGQAFYGETFYTNAVCVTARQDFVKQHPEAVKKFLRAMIKAETYVKQHPEESKRLVAKFVKADKALLDEIWDIYNFSVTLDQTLLVNLEDQTRWAMKNRLTKRRDMPNYLDFIYIDGLRAVKPDAVRIIR